jgi:hypothetical protein
MAGGGGGGGGQKQDDLAPHPVKDQLPGVSYCITSPPPWRQYLFSPHPLLSSARLLPVGLLVDASAAQILGVRSCFFLATPTRYNEALRYLASFSGAWVRGLRRWLVSSASPRSSLLVARRGGTAQICLGFSRPRSLSPDIPKN